MRSRKIYKFSVGVVLVIVAVIFFVIPEWTGEENNSLVFMPTTAIFVVLFIIGIFTIRSYGEDIARSAYEGKPVHSLEKRKLYRVLSIIPDIGKETLLVLKPVLTEATSGNVLFYTELTNRLPKGITNDSVISREVTKKDEIVLKNTGEA